MSEQAMIDTASDPMKEWGRGPYIEPAAPAGEGPIDLPADDPFEAPASRPSSGRAPHVRNHRYRLWNPDAGRMETWTRVSTFSKAITDQSGLMDWKARMVAKGVGLRPDLYELAAATPVEESQTLRSVAEQAAEAAQARAGANRGSALHAFCESVDKGIVPSVPPAMAVKVDQYRQALDDAGLEVIPDMIELIVIVPELELCGKFDRLYRTRDGRLVIGDLKTTDKIEYTWDQIGIQLACYAHAAYYWSAVDDDWRPMPPVDVEVGTVVHVPLNPTMTPAGPVDRPAEVIPVDIEAGWRAAKLARQVREYRSYAKNHLVLPLSALGGPTHAEVWARRLRDAATVQQLSAIWLEANAAGQWTDELTAIGKARQSQLANLT